MAYSKSEVIAAAKTAGYSKGLDSESDQTAALKDIDFYVAAFGRSDLSTVALKKDGETLVTFTQEKWLRKLDGAAMAELNSRDGWATFWEAD